MPLPRRDGQTNNDHRDVIPVSMHPDVGDVVGDIITMAGGKAAAMLGELTAGAAVALLLAEVYERIGGLDTLVDNAYGSGDKHRWEKTSLDAWSVAFDRNVLAAVRLTSVVLPRLRADRKRVEP